MLKQKELDKKKRNQRARELEQERYAEIEQLLGAQAQQEEVWFLLTYQVPQEIETEEFYCPVCEKSFKTENQLKNHEKSKLHLKKMKELLADVTLESEKHLIESVDRKLGDLRQDGTQQGGGAKKKKKKKKNKNRAQESVPTNQEGSKPGAKLQASWSLKNPKPNGTSESEQDSEDESTLHATRNPEKPKQAKNSTRPKQQDQGSDDSDSDSSRSDDQDNIDPTSLLAGISGTRLNQNILGENKNEE